MKPFKNVTVPEMKAFLGLIIAMAMGKLPTYDDYWKTGILQMPWFQSIMTRQRFRDILRYLHLVDNREIAEKDHPNYTKLGKLGKLDEKLSKLFRKMYHPGQNISIDEQMIGTKCRVCFIQYMPKKPKKFGIKIWACCDAETSYCTNFQIYTGATDQGPDQGLSYKDHNLFIDNFYTSLNLAKSLLDKGTYVCGTISTKMGEFPKIFVDEKLIRGKSIYLKIGNVLAVHWKNKRDVFVLSSFHGNQEVTIQRHQPR